jgi:hypothetical protein
MRGLEPGCADSAQCFKVTLQPTALVPAPAEDLQGARAIARYYSAWHSIVTLSVKLLQSPLQQRNPLAEIILKE